MQRAAKRCKMQQNAATRGTLQQSDDATRGKTRQCAAKRGNTRRNAAKRGKTQQCARKRGKTQQSAAERCKTLQNAANESRFGLSWTPPKRPEVKQNLKVGATRAKNAKSASKVSGAVPGAKSSALSLTSSARPPPEAGNALLLRRPFWNAVNLEQVEGLYGPQI